MIVFICLWFSLMVSDVGFALNHRARFWWPPFGLIHALVNAWGKTMASECKANTSQMDRTCVDPDVCWIRKRTQTPQ